MASSPETHLTPRTLVQPLSWCSLPSCIPLRREALRMVKAVERGLDWPGLPVIATVARLLCRGLTLQNEYVRLENRILKEKVSGRVRFPRVPEPVTRPMRGKCLPCGLWTSPPATTDPRPVVTSARTELLGRTGVRKVRWGQRQLWHKAKWQCAPMSGRPTRALLV